MPSKTKTEQEIGFLRSFWDEVREMEVEYKGAVHISETASQRPGVLEIHLTFTQIIGTLDAPISQARYKYTFPNAQEQTYAASKWVAARALHQVVQDMVRDLESRAPKRG